MKYNNELATLSEKQNRTQLNKPEDKESQKDHRIQTPAF